MNHQLYTFAALRLAQERADEATRYRLAQMAVEDAPSSPSLVRRSLAKAAASVSRGSAWVARRLDSCVADDLGRSLAPTE